MDGAPIRIVNIERRSEKLVEFEIELSPEFSRSACSLSDLSLGVDVVFEESKAGYLVANEISIDDFGLLDNEIDSRPRGLSGMRKTTWIWPVAEGLVAINEKGVAEKEVSRHAMIKAIPQMLTVPCDVRDALSAIENGSYSVILGESTALRASDLVVDRQ